MEQDRVRLQNYIPKKMKEELDKKSKEMGITETALVVLVIRAGLDVINVTMSADYAEMMKVLAKEYEKQKQ